MIRFLTEKIFRLGVKKKKSTDILIIEGNRPLSGNVRISGDPLCVFALSAISLFDDDISIISNVPRSKIVFEYLKVIDSIGIDVKWLKSDEVKLRILNGLSSDLTKVKYIYGYNITQVLIPLILYRNSKCLISESERMEAKYYRGIGMKVLAVDNGISISVPNFITEMENLPLLTNDFLEIASRHCLKKIFINDVQIHSDTKDTRIELIKNIVNGNKPEVYRCTHNELELQLLVTSAVLTKGDLNLYNINPADSLEFLLAMIKIAGNYEIMKEVLRVWYKAPDIHNFDYSYYHDFTRFHPLTVGLLLVLVCKYINDKHIKILIKKSEKLEQIITTLNILGMNIDYDLVEANSESEYDIVLVKPYNTKAPVKAPISEPYLGSIIFTVSLHREGVHRITKFEEFLAYFPDLIGNLKSINVSIK